jgi:hypothetical protein
VSAGVRQRPLAAGGGSEAFADFHAAMMANIAADLAAEDLYGSLSPADRTVAEQAWDEANLEQSAEAFAQGVAWAAQLAELSRRGILLRDDLPTQLMLDRWQVEHDRELADRDTLIAELRAAVHTLTVENSRLREVSSAVGATLRNKHLKEAERIVGSVTIMEIGSRASRGLSVDPWRPVIDAPKNRETPEDGERVGLATELGMSRNTVGDALDVFTQAGAPLAKTTVQERDDRGRLIRNHLEIRWSPSCAANVPGALWQFAHFKPTRTDDKAVAEPEPKHPKPCTTHPEHKVRVVHRAYCTIDLDDVTDEWEEIRKPAAEIKSPTHVFCAPVETTSSTSPGTYGNRTKTVRRPTHNGVHAPNSRPTTVRPATDQPVEEVLPGGLLWR